MIKNDVQRKTEAYLESLKQEGVIVSGIVRMEEGVPILEIVPVEPAVKLTVLAGSPLAAAALAAFLATSPASAGTEYRRFGGDVYGSDGSRAHSFAGTTTITKKGHKTVRCHRFAGAMRCE